MTSSHPCEIRLVPNTFVEQRWDEIRTLLATAHAGQTFLSGFGPERPAEHTWEKIHDPDCVELRHVVALGADERILGAIFCLPVQRPEGRTSCETGWLFTDIALPGAERTRISDAMVARTYEELTRAGYDALVGEMGTREGALYLSRRQGWFPAPRIHGDNRWIKGLRTLADSGVSSNSQKRSWDNATDELARYASVDIAKDELIVDLKKVMQRARRKGVDTLQLGERLHYRSSAGFLAMNHHCSANGYICFDDLTYRALRDVPAGTELTFNYCTTEYEMAEPFDCLCGSPDCLGRVAGFRYLDEQQVERFYPLLSPYLKSLVGSL